MCEADVMELGARNPQLFSYEMTRTKGARERIKLWVHAGEPDANPADVFFMGDREIHEALAHVLAHVPAAVRWDASQHLAVIGAGVATRGFHARSLALPCDAFNLSIIALTTCDLPVVAHELAHFWHRSAYVPPLANMADIREAKFKKPEAMAVLGPDYLEAAQRRDELNERIADELATCWGFPRDGRGLARDQAIRNRHAAAMPVALAAVDKENRQ